MRRTHYDPLTHIPAPETLRRHLAEAEALEYRLRILLRVSEELRDAGNRRDVGCGEEARRE